MNVRHAAVLPAVLAAVLCALPAAAPAQGPDPSPARAPRRLELRAEQTWARVARLEGSAGIVLPVGTYVRVALTGGAGVAGRGDARHRAYRGDAIVRFQLDPFHQAPAGIYGGAGVAWLGGAGGTGTARLAIGAGVELPEWGPLAPALEIGLAGGIRAGVALRPASRRWR